MKPSKKLLILTNYRLTGIGDFGTDLVSQLERVSSVQSVLETSPEGTGQIGQLIRCVLWSGPLVANVGLTSWGRSPIRNFLGFLTLWSRSLLGKKTVVLLHNAIEVIDASSSGYRISPITEGGGHLAVSLLRRTTIVVFSQRLNEILKTGYGIVAALVTPIPCRESAGTASPEPDIPIVVTPGYFSPYKGHGTLPAIRMQLKHRAQFVVVGGPHRALLPDPKYQEYYSSVSQQLQRAGIEVLGHLPDDALDELLAKSSAAILPYTSMQGGSATLSRLASNGVPVVAPKVGDVEWLRGLGAGILVAESSPSSLAGAVDLVLGDRRLREDLASRQVAFAARFRWPSFVDDLLPFLC